MKQYNLLFKRGEVPGSRANKPGSPVRWIPDDPMIRAAINIAKISRNKEVADRGKKDREE